MDANQRKKLVHYSAEMVNLCLDGKLDATIVTAVLLSQETESYISRVKQWGQANDYGRAYQLVLDLPPDYIDGIHLTTEIMGLDFMFLSHASGKPYPKSLDYIPDMDEWDLHLLLAAGYFSPTNLAMFYDLVIHIRKSWGLPLHKAFNTCLDCLGC